MRGTMFRILLLAAGVAPGCAPNAPPPPAGEAGASEYVFVPDTDRLVAIERVTPESTTLIGRLDIAGNFLEDPPPDKAPPGPPPDPAKRGIPVINAPYVTAVGERVPQAAYEYRSGRLVKGVIDPNGNFVPEPGSKVIAFADYRYTPGGLPIWNLPGRFVKKSELKK